MTACCLPYEWQGCGGPDNSAQRTDCVQAHVGIVRELNEHGSNLGVSAVAAERADDHLSSRTESRVPADHEELVQSGCRRGRGQRISKCPASLLVDRRPPFECLQEG